MLNRVGDEMNLQLANYVRGKFIEILLVGGGVQPAPNGEVLFAAGRRVDFVADEVYAPVGEAGPVGRS